MSIVQYRGFAGVRLEAEVGGTDDDPAVLLIHGAGQRVAVWAGVADALVQAGRRVISLDMRGHGGSEWPADGCYDVEALVEDLRAVLAQLGSRPMVVEATLGGWIAGAALARDAALLASGLVLIDLPLRVDAAAAAHVDERLHEAGLLAPGQAQWDVRLRDAFDPSEMAARFADVAANIMLPTLYVRGAMSEQIGRAH